jgi:hypothetical protein
MVKYTKKILLKELYKNTVTDNDYIAVERMRIPDWLEAI